MKEVVRVWCEYDVGQDEVVFASHDAATQWINTNPYLTKENIGEDTESLMKNGLLGISSIPVFA
jgi:hypothetical protein